ncbi:MAG TPA: Gfo/Idh/MocA family oxidoreductase [Candidatus Dormibacteraeota bacterium]|nr:Gfo/Idh/MocA family oxidoreductase [Candidatus Dormibacteraeota bacterium]
MSGGIGVGLVGLGMVSDLHRDALAEAGGIRLAAIHDIDPETLKRRAEEWDVRNHASLDAMLDDPEVEAVYVLTPAAAHVAIASRCLEAGRHVLVEKPVSHDPAEIEGLDRLAAGRGLVCMPGHNNAYTPEFRRLLRLRDEGELGTLRGLWVHYVLRHPEEIAAAYGGILEEVMVHHAYLALAVMGPPERIHAGIHPGAWRKLDREDQAWMVWEYPDGTTAYLFASFAADDLTTDPWTYLIKAIGTEGGTSISWRSAVGTRRRNPWFAFGIPIYLEAYRHETQAFAAAVRGEGAPASTLADAATSSRIISAAYEAARSHRVIERRDAGYGW